MSRASNRTLPTAPVPILSSTTNAVLGTIRRDGSPRLSGADPVLPRRPAPHLVDAAGPARVRTCVATHGLRCTASRGTRGSLRDGAADVGAADAKVSGTAVLATDAGEHVGVPRLVEVRAWRRAAGGLGSVHDRHRRAHGRLGRQRSALGRPVVDDRGPPDDASRVSTFPAGLSTHAVGSSGGCSSTRGRYSTSWMRPSKVRLSIISRATSG